VSLKSMPIRVRLGDGNGTMTEPRPDMPAPPLGPELSSPETKRKLPIKLISVGAGILLLGLIGVASDLLADHSTPSPVPVVSVPIVTPSITATDRNDPETIDSIVSTVVEDNYADFVEVCSYIQTVGYNLMFQSFKDGYGDNPNLPTAEAVFAELISRCP
jgi:hypothetical protein